MIQVENLARVPRRPKTYSEFKWRYACRGGFWEGWRDAVDRKPFREEYEREQVSWQFQYEQARECVATVRLLALTLPPWTERKRLVAVWNVMDRIMPDPQS